MSISLNIPQNVLSLIQTGLLERAFHDSLYPALLYRSEAAREEHEGNIGTEIFMTRAGLLAADTDPQPAGQDPLPQVVPYEQWVARVDRYVKTADIHMPTAAVANADLFVRTIQQLGLQAGDVVNSLARNAFFVAYESGNSVLTAATVAIDTQIQVASLNGFTDVVTTRPVPVSPSSPLSITIGSGVAAVTRNVIGFIQNDPNDPNGAGILQLSAAVGAIFATRSAVLSSARPTVIRSGGGDSVDAISGADSLVLQDIINGVAALRDQNVQPHPDGLYHVHISNPGEAQLFADPVFQRLHTAVPDGMTYKEGFLGSMFGCAFFLNTRSPNTLNAGTRSASGADPNAKYSKGIGAETTNASGVNIGRVLMTGRGSIYERWLNEERYLSEAGVMGKLGGFTVTNNGLSINTEGIRLYLRAPIDRTGDLVAATWSISTCFPIPSDVTATTGPQRFKRALVIQHAA